MLRVVADVDARHADWESTAKATLKRVLTTPVNVNVARNVILFIGDGMGVATVTAGRIYAAQQQGLRYGEETFLAFERFPHVGLAKVRAKSSLGGAQLRFYSQTPGYTMIRSGRRMVCILIAPVHGGMAR